ncbi:MAG TPA: lytic transglycosylase domain-containing protein [Candidatus Dormibacteraeota bacterium]|nr:lytic transglycosylase domain-containing protein [Candidatus Dormibacteraeota bacterium]
MRGNARQSFKGHIQVRTFWLIIGFSLATARLLRAADNEIDVDALMNSAQEWAKENLDEDALRVLNEVDQKRVKEVFAQIQKQFQAQSVLDLAGLRNSITAILPLLENNQETLPYALWLKSRLDYLEIADHLKRTAPPPKVKPGEPPRPLPNPVPRVEREVWIEKMAQRPWPENAKPYVTILKPIFVAQKVPGELVWLAEVESSFDPRARSPAGAAGLFQLMPDTARRYGLRVVPFFDQRLKPEPSAEAAAKYLHTLHSEFHDWRLALAAYNSGEGTVRNLLKRYKAHSFDSIAMHLPAETQMYVPKMEATLLRREGRQLSELSVD